MASRRFRTYDYGVVSIALSKVFCGDWPELLAIGQTLIESDEFEQRAEGLCRQILGCIGTALAGVRENLLSEDYLVYVVHDLDRPKVADELIVKELKRSPLQGRHEMTLK